MPETNHTAERVASRFIEAFGTIPSLYRSPGRINLIGEHTDYNQGLVLPAAIDRSVCVGIALRNVEIVRIRSASFGRSFEGRLADLAPTSLAWANYPIGATLLLMEEGFPLRGYDLFVDSDLPVGAGLSSSAAFTCATLFALDRVFKLGLSRDRMASLAQRTEHRFAGVNCGIMDPFASLFGERDRFLRLDCRSMACETVPFTSDDVAILLLDTNVKHSLASSEYNLRRAQCEQGVEWVREAHPGVESLRDVDHGMLVERVLPRDPVSFNRCRYVLEENGRVMDLCRRLEAGDLVSAGACLYASHQGLRTLYEVSCRELDWLVDNVRNDPDVLGARMMGGGFGGCTINLVRKGALERIVGTIVPAYERETGLELTWMTVIPAEGSSEIPFRGV